MAGGERFELPLAESKSAELTSYSNPQYKQHLYSINLLQQVVLREIYTRCKPVGDRLAERPIIELRLPVRVGGISNPLGYHYPTAPNCRLFRLSRLVFMVATSAESEPLFWRRAEVSIPTPSLVPLVFKTRLRAGANNPPYKVGHKAPHI